MLKCSKLNLLVAYPYFDKKIEGILKERNPDHFRLIIDSGAFSAWNSQKHIDLHEYCNFLKTIPKQWDYKAVQLDVFGDPKKTVVNYNKMLDMGFDEVMPVFTRGDSLETLEGFYKHSDYIMFGGIVVGGKNTNYIKWFHQHNKDRKVHWLGYNNTEFVKYFKPTSVDSTTWNNGQKYGRLDIYNDHGTFISTVRTDWAKKPTDRMMYQLKKLGYETKDIMKLSQKESWTGGSQHQIGDNFEFKGVYKGLAASMNNTSHLKRALDIENNLGTRVYLACGNYQQINSLFMAFYQLQSKKLN